MALHTGSGLLINEELQGTSLPIIFFPSPLLSHCNNVYNLAVRWSADLVHGYNI
jgi:hypothetical protein